MTKFVILAQLLISTMVGGSVFAAEPDLQLQLEARYAAMKAAMPPATRMRYPHCSALTS